MHDSYIINGGKPLRGEVTLSGAKNASIKLMIASVLFDGPTVLCGVPHNGDNAELINLLNDIGVSVHYEGNTVTVNPTQINKHIVSLLYGSKVRSSFLLFGPLLHRFGEAHIPNPGGCRIGARPIERIINGIQALNVDVQYNPETGYYVAKSKGDIGGEYTFEKQTHTGTEALILLATCGTGKVTLHNCALEPEIDDLIMFLINGGADIRRDGKTIYINGVSLLSQKTPHTVVVDRNEAVTFAALAFATRGEITLTNLDQSLIHAFIEKVRVAGGGVEILSDTRVRFKFVGRLKATDIQTSPHPGYMTDWQPQWGLMMATADGVSTIHETMLEARLKYIQELQKVGAEAEFFQPTVADPHALYQFNYEDGKDYLQAVRITGVPKLHNGVMNVHDLRAGAVVVMAGLSAEGETIINGVAQLERGYENLIQKISALGGKIKKV